MMRRLASLLIALTVCAATSAWAGAYEDGQAAYSRSDNPTALRLFRRAADRGHAGAQYKLGVMYSLGQGVPKNEPESLAWLRKAADQGHANAQLSVGLSYSNGVGVPKDEKEAASWYRKAAEQGFADAQYCLAGAYYWGDGVPKNEQTAYFWLLLAAVQGESYVHEFRAIAEKTLTPEQRWKAQTDASAWKPKPTN